MTGSARPTAVSREAAPRAGLRGRLRHPLLIGIAAMVVAFNLRPALTSVGSLLTGIAAATGLPAFGAAVLTTLPVLCLGLGSALGPRVIRRLGIDGGVLGGLLVIAAGLALRALDSLSALFAGAAVSGLGIGVVGVLLPALVKRDFPKSAGPMTGLYTMTLCLGAAAGTGLSVPLADRLGWASALACWCLPALLAALAWAPVAIAAPTPAQATDRRRARLGRDALAWQVTGFMGLQSSLAYVLFGWLPAVLQGRGLSPLDAGALSALMTLGQAPGALVIATLAGRRRDQRGWIVGVILATAAAFLAMAFGPRALLIPSGLVLGVCIGGCFGLGLTLIVMRARDAASAGALSAMAQAVGYTVASLGPFGFGLLHDASGGWVLSAGLFCVIALGALACGLGAGRDRVVGQA